MKFLAISGSARACSVNSAMLRIIADIVRTDHDIRVFDGVGGLPIFSPDLAGGAALPQAVADFATLIRESDGLILASPEYVRAIPGGLKNALDWMVSRDELTGKPIALLHGSARGDDMLAQLRVVLATVSTGFNPDLFLRFALPKQGLQEIAAHLYLPQNLQAIHAFLRDFAAQCQRGES